MSLSLASLAMWYGVPSTSCSKHHDNCPVPQEAVVVRVPGDFLDDRASDIDLD